MTDAQKAVLPGATITVTSEDTGLTREAVADGAGRYVIPQLLPGTYTVKAELSGFQPMVRMGMARRESQCCGCRFAGDRFARRHSRGSGPPLA